MSRGDPGTARAAALEPVLVLNRSEVERLLDPRALLSALADGFRALTAGEVAAPPRNELAMSDGSFLLAMPGHRRGGDLTVKIVTLFEANVERGMPAHLATVLVHDGRTGACRAILDGTFVTALRTSAAAALAADLLARPDARTLAVIGAGVQGEHHVRTFPLVRVFDDIRVASRRHADAEALVARYAGARAVRDVREAVRGADVVALATSAGRPVLDPEWIGPGTHVSSVGYSPPGGELPRELARSARLFVETRLAFAPTPAGCGELQGLDAATGTELGEVLLGRAEGRTSDDEITVYKAMGHIVEDMAAVELALGAAQREGVGTRVAL